EPDLVRPFRAPLYPLFPATALIIAAISGVAVVYYNPVLFAILIGLFVLGYIYFRLVVVKSLTAEIYRADDFETLRKTGELPPLEPEPATGELRD
ncbi:MAG: hypothetical protein CVV27_02340, partial [Candidatus Melainabacteria bacterium HGW-Melainabacteria-1]